MKTLHRHASRAPAFTLLEVIVVLAITVMVLSGVYSLAQGTLTLADDVRRAERRDARTQAFITFCEHLLAGLPPTATLNLTTTHEQGQYLTRLELENVPSPLDGAPGCLVTLYTETAIGGGMRLNLSCSKLPDKKQNLIVTLFDNLNQCEWRVFDASTRQWASVWTEQQSKIPPPPITPPPQPPPAVSTPTPTPPGLPPLAATIRYTHPPLLELNLITGTDSPLRSLFWIHSPTPIPQ
jgi:prepilin-type N-terminal cleavage/methylation domain-containing protein